MKKECEVTGEIMYQCPNCGDWDYDAIAEDSECMVCFEFENNPEVFELTEEQNEEWNVSSKYVMDNKITANVDFPAV